MTYVLNFLDKGILSNASVFGLRDDTHLVGQQYSWVGSIFYFGYVRGSSTVLLCAHVTADTWLANPSMLMRFIRFPWESGWLETFSDGASVSS